MSYTYLPHTPFCNAPTIIMTTPPSSKKTSNLYSNPKVSLLVHDWVSHRPRTLSSTPSATGADTLVEPQGGRSSLANFLYGLNSASISRISVSINGTAHFVPAGSEEEAWCKAKHKELNTFGDSNLTDSPFGNRAEEAGDGGDGGAGCYIEGQDVRVLVVSILDGRISDWKGTVKDWTLQYNQAEITVNGANV
jgi:hypothetical protein